MKSFLYVAVFFLFVSPPSPSLCATAAFGPGCKRLEPRDGGHERLLVSLHAREDERVPGLCGGNSGSSGGRRESHG